LRIDPPVDADRNRSVPQQERNRLVSRPVVVLNKVFFCPLFQIRISAMAEFDPATGRKRTAILVVHGIGSQRALETVRGVMRGIWLDPDNPSD
jgi:hypothetical protein